MIQKRLMWVTGAVVAASSAIVGVAAATAGPAGTVPAHRHFVVNSAGDLVPVGPNACADGVSVQFDNFHSNVHRGEPGGNGIISASGCG